MTQRSRPVLVVGGLLALIVLVVWAGTSNPGSTTSTTAVAEMTAIPTAATPGTTIPTTAMATSDGAEPANAPLTFFGPVLVNGVAVIEMTEGAFAFEVVGYGEETVHVLRVLPETLDDRGRYYRLRWDRGGNAVGVEESVDGVVWTMLAAIPDTASSPWLIAAEDGVILRSYGYDDTRGRPDSWGYWRWKSGEWAPLIGIPADAGFAGGPMLRAESGDEVLVTVGEGPLAGMARGGWECLGVQGVTSTEFGMAVNVVDTCGELPTGTLSLVGSGDGAVAVLSDESGTVLWRSAPGVERHFELLLSFALSAGPESPSNADHIIFTGGQQRFWTSTDGLRFELASTLEVSPWAIPPTVLDGELIVLQPEITLTAAAEGERIGEPSGVRVLTSPDARTWMDTGLNVALPVGVPMGQITVTAAGGRVLVTVLDRRFLGTSGRWEELEGLGPWERFRSLGDRWLAYDYGRELVLGISSDGVSWDSFVLNQLVEALDCGTELNWRVVGDEVWFSSWGVGGVCIIRGRFTPTP